VRFVLVGGDLLVAFVAGNGVCVWCVDEVEVFVHGQDLWRQIVGVRVVRVVVMVGVGGRVWIGWVGVGG